MTKFIAVSLAFLATITDVIKALEIITVDKLQANSFLHATGTRSRKPRMNSGFFEELGGGSFEAECQEEICNREELSEIFKDDMGQAELEDKWQSLKMACLHDPCDARGTHTCTQYFGSRVCSCKTPRDIVKDEAEFNVLEKSSNSFEWARNISSSEYDSFAYNVYEGEICENNVNICEDYKDKIQCDQSLKLQCTNVPANKENPFGYTCGCSQGYEQLTFGSACVDIDECATGIHDCSGEDVACRNTEGAYSCECINAGFEYNYDTKSCERVLECGSINCPPNERCALSENGEPSCICNDGYSRGFGDTAECFDINECDDGSTCSENQLCFNTQGGFECHDCIRGQYCNLKIGPTCGEGWLAKEDTESCEDIFWVGAKFVNTSFQSYKIS